jgi:septum formation protein
MDGGEIYGKPVDAADAVRMLRDLRDRGHVVISAISVLRLSDRRPADLRINYTTVRCATTPTPRSTVVRGLRRPAGQGRRLRHPVAGFAPSRALRGCYASVMGLPLADLRDLLASFDVAMQVPVDGVCRRYSGAMCCAAAAAGGMLDQPIC